MTDSILDSIKKNLGIDSDYVAFDADILMHINSVLGNFPQLGIGPEEAVYVETKDEKWELLIGNNKNLNAIKTLVYLKVRLLFDPPTTSFTITAMEKQIEEQEWRLSAEGERLRRWNYR